jgi:hypothetical protein
MKNKIHKQLNKIAFTLLENIGFKKSDFLDRDIFPLRKIEKTFICDKVFPLCLKNLGSIDGMFLVKLENYKIKKFQFEFIGSL